MGIKVVGSKSTVLLDLPLAKSNYSADFPYFHKPISSFQKNSLT